MRHWVAHCNSLSFPLQLAPTPNAPNTSKFNTSYARFKKGKKEGNREKERKGKIERKEASSSCSFILPPFFTVVFCFFRYSFPGVDYVDVYSPPYTTLYSQGRPAKKTSEKGPNPNISSHSPLLLLPLLFSLFFLFCLSISFKCFGPCCPGFSCRRM